MTTAKKETKLKSSGSPWSKGVVLNEEQEQIVLNFVEYTGRGVNRKDFGLLISSFCVAKTKQLAFPLATPKKIQRSEAKG